jgi:hypothetical protein
MEDEVALLGVEREGGRGHSIGVDWYPLKLKLESLEVFFSGMEFDVMKG